MLSKNVCADPVLDVPVAEIIVHENYEQNSKLQTDDIALIRLAQSVTFTDWISPICLPFSEHLRNNNLENAPLIVTGFGKTENGLFSFILSLSSYRHPMNIFNLK